MKNLRNVTMALLAAGLLAACSSSRNAGMGGTDGTTGMESGSSTDLSTTSETMDNTSIDYSSNTVNYENNSDSEDVYGNTSMDYSSDAETYESHWDSEWGYGNSSMDYSSDAITYENHSDEESYSNTWNSNSMATDAYAGKVNIWGGPETTDETGLNYTDRLSYIMNGYQGPLNYEGFDNFSSSQSFLPLASESGTREIELSRIAQLNAESEAVRAFADMMVTDHTRNGQEIESIAYSQNITLTNPGFVSAVTSVDPYQTDDPNAYVYDEAGDLFIDTNDDGINDAYSSSDSGAGNTSAWSDTGTSNSANANDLNMLRNLSGREFDRQYMRILLQDHYKARALFNSAATSDDPQVRDFAVETLPVLQDHLVKATNIYNTLL